MKIKNIFKRKKDLKIDEKKFIKMSHFDDILFTHVYHNDAISIVHDACVICVDGVKERSYKEKIDFIEGKIKLGHESILEHSNYIISLVLKSENNFMALTELMGCFKYLNVKTKLEDIEGQSTWNVLIGGSVRGFKHMIRMNNNPKNPVYKAIVEWIKMFMPSCFFIDLIEDNIFSKSDFLDVNSPVDGYNISDYKNIDYRKMYKSNDYKDRNAIILYKDPIEEIYNRLEGKFSYYELMDFASVNVIFKDVSRACSHQLVRHRGGITQLSQRYVSMSDKEMVLPTMDEDSTAKCKSIINDCKDLYNDLISNKVKKEDARYILPNACATTLYMTFTYRNFIKAYILRTSKGAQQEIKDCFHELFITDGFADYINNLQSIGFKEYCNPIYSFEAFIQSLNNISIK